MARKKKQGEDQFFLVEHGDLKVWGCPAENGNPHIGIIVENIKSGVQMHLRARRDGKLVLRTKSLVQPGAEVAGFNAVLHWEIG